MTKLDLLKPYLHHRETCDKWRQGWWDDGEDCTCGLEGALIIVSDALLEDFPGRVDGSET